MDRKLSEEEKKRKAAVRAARAVAAVVVIVSLMTAAVLMLRPGVDLAEMELSRAGYGDLDISLGAVGSVVPYYEEVITSPIQTKILEVYRKSGDVVSRGDTIMKLDLSSANVDFLADMDDIEIRKCKLEQYRTSFESNLKDIEMQIRIDEMQLRRMEAQLENEHYLDSIGASTKDKVKQRELEYEVAKLQFEQLKLKRENMENVARSDMKVYELEYKIALDRFSIKNKMLGEAQIVAPRNATLSWVNDQIGTNVSLGSQLAILSDLSRFKVNAEISDSYAGKFNVGDRVSVRIGETELSGSVANIVPAVSNGMVLFTVLLDDNMNAALRPGLRVDVFVVNSVRQNVLKIANRSYYSGAGEYELWVVMDGRLVRRDVVLGESSADEVEVIDGIKEGETVVVSSMSRFRDKDEIRIRSTRK